MPLWSIKFIDTTCLQKSIKNSPLNLFNLRNQKTCSCFQFGVPDVGMGMDFWPSTDISPNSLF